MKNIERELVIERGSRLMFSRRFGRIKSPQMINRELTLGGYNNKGFWTEQDVHVPNGYLRLSKITWLLKYGEYTGVGNYMANEALGRLDLSPFTPCSNKDEAIKLLQECISVAKESFKQGGNSFTTGFFQLNGLEGGYLPHCRFYQNPKLHRYIFRGRPLYTRFKP